MKEYYINQIILNKFLTNIEINTLKFDNSALNINRNIPTKLKCEVKDTDFKLYDIYTPDGIKTFLNQKYKKDEFINKYFKTIDKTNNLQVRYNPGLKQNNGDLPFEHNIKIQPGLNGIDQKGRYNMNRILPKNIDQLRAKTNKKLKELSKSKINRLSIGIQSFNDKELKIMNRVHNSLDSKKCIERSKNILIIFQLI